MNIKTFKQNLLNKLYEPYKQCMQCPLGALGRTHVVFGEGNPDARLIFIGEGPGRNEDLEGRPFVGRAGKLLQQAFEKLNIQRSNVYITNVVKCRPPGNRAPLPIESTTCKNLLLYNQIKIIRPQVIITLGSVALEALLDKKLKISAARGSVINFHGIHLIPAYHPAYILRNPTEFHTLVHDIGFSLKFLKE